MRRTLLFIAAALALFVAPSCATQFSGSPQVRGGVAGCISRCRSQNMVLGAYVYVGEYSTACVCEPSTRTAAASGATASVPAAVGVALQMRRHQDQRVR